MTIVRSASPKKLLNIPSLPLSVNGYTCNNLRNVKRFDVPAQFWVFMCGSLATLNGLIMVDTLLILCQPDITKWVVRLGWLVYGGHGTGYIV